MSPSHVLVVFIEQFKTAQSQALFHTIYGVCQVRIQVDSRDGRRHDDIHYHTSLVLSTVIPLSTF